MWHYEEVQDDLCWSFTEGLHGVKRHFYKMVVKPELSRRLCLKLPTQLKDLRILTRTIQAKIRTFPHFSIVTVVLSLPAKLPIWQHKCHPWVPWPWELPNQWWDLDNDGACFFLSQEYLIKRQCFFLRFMEWLKTYNIIISYIFVVMQVLLSMIGKRWFHTSWYFLPVALSWSQTCTIGWM